MQEVKHYSENEIQQIRGKEQKNLATIIKGKNIKKNKSHAGGNIKWMKIFILWLHQGFTYLDRTEMFFRVIWELVPFVFVIYLLSLTSLQIWIKVIVAFIISHSLNFIFNFNFWTGVTFFFPNTKNPGNEETIKYLACMQTRMAKYESITGVMVYGSLSRGVWHDKSDLDTRIIHKKGIINSFIAYLIVHSERIRAVFNKQPLDMYMADSVEFLNLMRDDEFPIFLKIGDERLVQRYKMVECAKFSNIQNINELADDSFIKLRALYGDRFDKKSTI